MNVLKKPSYTHSFEIITSYKMLNLVELVKTINSGVALYINNWPLSQTITILFYFTQLNPFHQVNH